MSISNECKSLLLSILAEEILKIRSLAIHGDSENVVHIADHIHNIPNVISGGRPELLDYYLSVEVPCYITATGGTKTLERAWDELKNITRETHQR